MLLTLGTATPLQADDLLSIYKLAIQSDPQFRAAQAESMAVMEAKPQAKALFLPNLSLSANVTDNRTETTDSTFFPSVTDDFTSSGYSLSLDQTIYHHEYFVQLRQADARVSQAQTNLNAARQGLMLRVAESYFAVLGAQDNLVFALAEKTSIDHQLLQTKQRFNVGVTAITDVHEAQARYDQAVAQAIAAQNLLAVNIEKLREITGKAHKTLAIVSKTTPLIAPDPQDIEQWVKTALDQNMLLIASERSMDIARDEVARQRSGHYPTLDIVASHSHSDTTGSAAGNVRDSTSIGLELNVPIYQGGLVSSKTREAAYRYQQAQEQYQQQRRATERQARNAFLNVMGDISQAKALRQALASSQTALEATQVGFEVGTRTTVDVLNSQRELYRARRDYAQARYDYLLETLRLKQAAGILTDVDLEQINKWLK